MMVTINGDMTQFGPIGRSVLRMVRIVAFSTIWIGGTAIADVRIDQADESVGIFITGTITRKDADEISKIESDFFRKAPYIWLDSEGGEVDAALRIGRVIRKHDGTTFIVANGRCHSGCALVFISGVLRIILTGGELGLHRPYFVDAPQSREAIERQVPLLLSSVRSYITEMGITDNVYQQMVNTEPSEMIRYNEKNYRTIIPEYDPVYDEISIAESAFAHGVTTDEMRRRETQVKSRCGKLRETNEFLPCANPIRWNLSRETYRQREADAQEACKMTAEEDRIWQAATRKERLSLPIYIKSLACRRSIMAGQHRR